MNKKTYNILTFTIGGLVIFGGRYIGLSLLQRIIAFIAIGGSSNGSNQELSLEVKLLKEALL